MAKISFKKALNPWHFSTRKHGFQALLSATIHIYYICVQPQKMMKRRAPSQKKILHAHNGKYTREKNSKDGVQLRHNEIIKG